LVSFAPLSVGRSGCQSCFGEGVEGRTSQTVIISLVLPCFFLSHFPFSKPTNRTELEAQLKTEKHTREENDAKYNKMLDEKREGAFPLLL
jgi:hypothetical protein